MSQPGQAVKYGTWENGWNQKLPTHKSLCPKLLGRRSSEGPGKPVSAELLVPSSDQVSPGEKIPCAGVVRISLIPDPETWNNPIEVKMAIFEDSVNASGNNRAWSFYETYQGKFADGPDQQHQSSPVVVGGQELKEDADALYFLFKDITFPNEPHTRAGAFGPIWRVVFMVLYHDGSEEMEYSRQTVGYLTANQSMKIKEGAKRTNPINEEGQALIAKLLQSPSNTASTTGQAV